MRIADMDDDVGLGDLFERRAEGGDEMGRKVRNKADRVRQDRLAARWQVEPAHRRVEGRKQQILGADRRMGQVVEEGRFAGIRVADEGDDRVRHPPACLAVQGAGALDVVELAPEPGDALADQAAVDFELALARAAEKAETAALPLQMGPGAHQPRALIRQRRQFDLQPPLMGAGALTKDFENQAGAVDNLGLPAAFQIALLYRRERPVDDDKTNRVLGNQFPQFLDIAAAEQGARRRPRDAHDFGAHDLEIDGARQADGLVETSLERARRAIGQRPRRGFRRGMDDEGAIGARGCRGVEAAQSSSPSRLPSKSWIGCAGITVEIACL